MNTTSIKNTALRLMAATGAILLPLAPVYGQTYSGYSGHQVIVDEPTQNQFHQLPSYPYDPALDTKNLPPPPRPVELHNDKDLTTHSGIDLGLQVSDYRYEEPNFGVKLTGPKFGANAILTHVFHQNWFITGDFRGAFGFSDYSGSGTHDGNFEDLWDLRGLVGKDFIASDFSVTPFFGFGFRDFYSDDRGTSSTGAHGYRRQNNLYYLPFGIEPRFRVTEDARIAFNVEYDYVLFGQQTSTLSDANPGLTNITNNQKSGYGLRGNIMWETARWAFGPFLNYWNIQQSNLACADGNAYGVCGYEPTNNTIEGGLQARYHFY